MREKSVELRHTQSNKRGGVSKWDKAGREDPKASAVTSRLRTTVRSARVTAFPRLQLLQCPSGGFVRVARGARIRNFVFVGHRRRDERESVRVNHTSAISSRSRACGRRRIGCPAAVLVMRVLFDRRRAWAVRRDGPWQSRQSCIGWLAQLRVVVGAMNIVAIEAGDAAAIHHALHEIVALHAVLVRGAVGEMSESRSRPECGLPASSNPAASVPRR